MKKSLEETNKKKMTIDDLARMVANGFESVKSELRAEFKGGIKELRGEMQEGFEELRGEMRSGFKKVDDQFDDVDKRFDTLEAGTHRRLTVIEGALKTFVKK